MNKNIKICITKKYNLNSTPNYIQNINFNNHNNNTLNNFIIFNEFNFVNLFILKYKFLIIFIIIFFIFLKIYLKK